MSVTLRDAAEKVVTQFCNQGADCHCSAGLTFAVGDLRSALSAPDPVDEAREIIRLLPEAFDAAAHWIEACPFENAIPHAARLRQLEEKSRDWLKKNGGDK